jgi:hypothetical protein
VTAPHRHLKRAPSPPQQPRCAVPAPKPARPCLPQELAVPPLLEGRDVVLAAETGSGKTLAYLAPLATLLQRARAPQPADGAGGTSAGADAAAAAGGARAVALAAATAEARLPLALVLVPNTALAAQVLAAAGSLRDAAGGPLLRACTVSSRSPPPFERPDLVVTTPGALVTLLRDVAGGYGRLWTPEGLGDAVRHVVVDEADLLLTGGYERDLKRLLEVSRGAGVASDERGRAAARMSRKSVTATHTGTGSAWRRASSRCDGCPPCPPAPPRHSCSRCLSAARWRRRPPSSCACTPRRYARCRGRRSWRCGRAACAACCAQAGAAAGGGAGQRMRSCPATRLTLLRRCGSSTLLSRRRCPR